MANSSSTDAFGDYLDWKQWPGESFGRFSVDEAQYFSAETAGSLVSPGRVLEVGYGNGQLLGWLRSRGHEVYGVEVNPFLVAHARRELGEGHAFASLDDPTLQNMAGSFNEVIALDVLEHVPQDSLPGFLAQLGKLLSASGRILIRFPNGDSPFGRIYQHGDPTHVTTIGRAKLEYFARRAGLTLIELRAPALPRTGTLSRRLRRLMLQAGRAMIERVIGMLYFGGRIVPLDPNYVAVLGKSAVSPG